MSYKSSCKKSWKKFLLNLGTFLGKGLVIGKWEVKFTWKF